MLVLSCCGSNHGFFLDDEDEDEGVDKKKGKKRGSKVPRSKIKSLLSLDLPDRPPPGLAGLGKQF